MIAKAHQDEVKQIGIAIAFDVPAPRIYPLSSHVVTTADEVTVQGDRSSGEVEIVLYQGDELWVGVGSDHTDRTLETASIVWSKQACANVLAPTLWRFADIADHWDRCRMRAWVGGELYQDCGVDLFLRPEDMLRILRERVAALPGAALHGLRGHDRQRRQDDGVRRALGDRDDGPGARPLHPARLPGGQPHGRDPPGIPCPGGEPAAVTAPLVGIEGRTDMLNRRDFGKAAAGLVAAPYVIRPAFAQSGGATLVVAATRTPGGFDGDALRPNTQNVVVQIYEGLTRYATVTGPDGRPRIDGTKVEPHLAESWTSSEDGKTWVFKLREGVKSFAGNELTSEDVVWGWQKSLAQNRTGAFIARVSSVEKVEPVSKYEVRFSLSGPNTIFLRALTLYTPSIYDSKVTKQNATPDDPWALHFLETATAGLRPLPPPVPSRGPGGDLRRQPELLFAASPISSGSSIARCPSAANRMTLIRAGQVTGPRS